MRVFIVLFTLLFSLQALAWGKQGHRISSAIAEPYLSPEAKAMVSEILGVETIAEASTWPDFMRSNPDTFWQRQSPRLHYVTIPIDKLKPNKKGDAFSGLKDFRANTLDKTLPLEKRQLALRFAIHIITDLHQPLHAGNGKDRGANDIKVKFFGQDSNLHRVWDTQLIDHEKLSYSEWASWLLPRISEQQAKDWCVTEPMVWALESRNLHDKIYPGRKNLSWQYVYKSRKILRLRLQQGGVRLACYLNQMASDYPKGTSE
ncbi:MAG: S1/P1 nuclease [Cellvibrionaceae bacterium]|nr:S1/P1 nuclease [Cellvibrionaceae bacterium]